MNLRADDSMQTSAVGCRRYRSAMAKTKTGENPPTLDTSNSSTEPSKEERVLQRPPAEVLYAGEIAKLKEGDSGPKPPGWQLSARAIRTFLLGDERLGIRKKFVGNAALIDRAMVTLATNRGLMLVGEPGTAKSLLSELLAASICGQSTLTIQGSAATTDDQIKYSWNYALLLAKGPTTEALVPAPLYTGMKEGRIVRFEEITRCPLEVQDSLLSVLSDRVLAIAELEGDESSLFARQGFGIIATANTRDRGCNEMSAALKRRFNFETVFPISSARVEMELVRDETRRLLERSEVPTMLSDDVLEVLVTTFRDLRSGETDKGDATTRLSVPMSTAEAVSVAHAVAIRSHYLNASRATPADVLECLVGAAVKDSTEDLKKLRAYMEQRVAKRTEPHWQAFYEARHALPE
jgi:MoxR-like ATPase